MFIYFLTAFFVFLLGLCIGSFLNCLIYRLEEEKTIKGRSFCPHCRHTLIWKDLLPVLSFLVLRGKCRYCKKKISFQYPAVEILTGLVFLLIFINQFSSQQEILSISFSGIARTSFLFYITSSLIAIFVYDLKHFLIPDKILFPATAVALLYRIAESPHLIGNYILAVLIGSAFFLSVFLISKGQWIGFGDVKLAILLGLILGFPKIILGLFLAFFFGAIIGVIMMVFQKRGLKSEIPFGPFLIIGTAISFFWGSQMIDWYLGMLIFAP